MNHAEAAKTRRIRRICLSLEIDELAGTIIVELLERMEELRRDLERLRVLEDLGSPRRR